MAQYRGRSSTSCMTLATRRPSDRGSRLERGRGRRRWPRSPGCAGASRSNRAGRWNQMAWSRLNPFDPRRDRARPGASGKPCRGGSSRWRRRAGRVQQRIVADRRGQAHPVRARPWRRPATEEGRAPRRCAARAGGGRSIQWRPLLAAARRAAVRAHCWSSGSSSGRASRARPATSGPIAVVVERGERDQQRSTALEDRDPAGGHRAAVPDTFRRRRRCGPRRECRPRRSARAANERPCPSTVVAAARAPARGV